MTERIPSWLQPSLQVPLVTGLNIAVGWGRDRRRPDNQPLHNLHQTPANHLIRKMQPQGVALLQKRLISGLGLRIEEPHVPDDALFNRRIAKLQFTQHRLSEQQLIS